MTPSTMNFGGFLQKKREEKKITLRKMAELLGFSAPFLSDVEKDRRNPPEFAKLEQIAEILGLSTSEKETMYDLAGKKRASVPPDLPEYIMSHNYVITALRIARDSGAGKREWLKFINDLKCVDSEKSK